MGTPRRGRPAGSKDGDGAAQPKAFEIRQSAKPKRGKLAVTIGHQPFAHYGDEVSLDAGLAIVTVDEQGMRIVGEGVVRVHGTTIAVTA